MQALAIALWLLIMACTYAWAVVEARRPLPEADAREIRDTVNAENGHRWTIDKGEL